MKRARCKFTVQSVCDEGWSKTIKLRTEYDESIEEDQKFSVSTPSGELEFVLNNPALDGFFEPKKQFYVDLIPVNPEE